VTDEEKENMLVLLDKVSKSQPITTYGDYLQKFFAEGLIAVTNGVVLEKSTLKYGTNTTGSTFKKDSKAYNKYIIDEIEKEAKRVQVAKEEEEREQRERAAKQAGAITPRTMEKIVSLPARCFKSYHAKSCCICRLSKQSRTPSSWHLRKSRGGWNQKSKICNCRWRTCD
jgi:hypothetical protein